MMDMTSLPWMIYPAFAVIAFFYASAGLGGATGYLAVLALVGVTTPAVAPTVLCLNVLIASTSFSQYYKSGQFRALYLLPFVAASLPAAVVGGLLPVPDVVFQVVLGGVLLAAGVRLIRGRAGQKRPARTVSPLGHWTAALLAGSLLGLIAGITGSGGGFLLIPVLILVFDADPKEAACAAAAFVVINSLGALGGHLFRGHFALIPTVVLAAAALAGGLPGARLGASRLNAQTVQYVISAVLLVGGVKLLVTAFTS